MKNIIRSQLYQLKKNRLLFIIFIGVNVVSIAVGMMMSAMTDNEYELGASYFIATLFSICAVFIEVIPAAVAGLVCAGDFKDKTSNYEIMSGSLRAEAYFGRIVVSVVLSVIMCAVSMALSPIIVTAVYGWGTSVTVESFVIRVLVSTLPIIKMTCFCCLLSFVIKSSAAVMAVHMGGIILVTTIINMTGGMGGLTEGLFAPFDFMKVVSYSSYSTYGLNNEDLVWMLFRNELPSRLLAPLAALSLLFSAAYIIIGYHYYHKDDLS